MVSSRYSGDQRLYYRRGGMNVSPFSPLLEAATDPRATLESIRDIRVENGAIVGTDPFGGRWHYYVILSSNSDMQGVVRTGHWAKESI